MAIALDWTILIAAGGVCYTAGSIVNKIMNGKHVTKEVCAGKEELVQVQLRTLKDDVGYIRDSIDDMRGIPRKREHKD